MGKPKSIRRKISALLLGMVLTALFLTGAVSLWSLYTMHDLSEESSKMLGQTAAEDAEEALEAMAEKQLLIIATQKAAYIDQKFNTVIACVDGIAQAAETIYKNPENYPDRTVPLPEKNSTKLAPQLLRSKRLRNMSEEQLAELLKLGNLQDLLVQYNANNDMISSVYLATRSGWMLQADSISYSKYSGESDVPDFFEAPTRQWYQRAYLAEPGQCVYTDVMEDIHQGGNCIVCARAVRSNGEIVAVAGVGSYLDTVNEAVLNTVIGERGYAFLLNDKGQVLVSGAETGETETGAADLRKSGNGKLAQVAKDMVAGGSKTVKLTLDGKEVYLAYVPLEDLGWSFATVIDVAEVIAPAKESQQEILALTDVMAERQHAAIRKGIHFFLVIVAVMAMVIIEISVFFTGKLTVPIRRLTQEVRRIDGGNLDIPIRITTGDEVEELGNAFNGMTAQLKQYIGSLEAATAEKERIRTELSLASGIQADMLPDSDNFLREREELTLYASMNPAKEVGGDFYDFFLTDEDHLVILIADVSGKGIPAALFMVVAKTLLQSCITGSATLAEAVAEVNDRLCVGNKNGMFVTAWIGVLTLSEGLLTYVNAGHNPPLLGNRENGYHYLRDRGGFVLAGMEHMKYSQKELRMKQGDILFLYTDGVTEANDENGNLYGESRLQELIDGRSGTEPEMLAKAVWDDIQDFQGKAEQFDDITMLALRYRGAGKKRNTGPASMERMDEIQEFVEKVFGENQIPHRDIRQFLIASDEIVSNVCRYSKASSVTVECGAECGTEFGEEIVRAVLVVEDDGAEFNPLERPKPDVNKSLRDRKIGGLGIYMVQEMMDEVSYERKDGKNRLTMMKKVKRSL